MRVFITGASGLLGGNAAMLLSSLHEVTGVYHRNPIHSPAFSSVRGDLTDAGFVAEVMQFAKPDVVIHSAALTDVEACESDPALAERLNVQVSRNVAHEAARLGARMIHVSTDMLFDGELGHYREDAEPSPVNVYARTKLGAEIAVAEEQPDSVIVRTNIFGWNAQDKLSLAEWVLDRYSSNLDVPGFTDAYFTPILVNDLVDVFESLATASFRGVLNVAGRDRLSKFEFAALLARGLSLDPSRVVPSTLADVHFKATRPHDLSLDTSLARSLGVQSPPIEDGVARFVALRSSGYARRLKAMTEEG